MKIRIVTERVMLIATLDDNPTAKDFAALLPLEFTLEDHAATEKTSDLPRPLSVAAAPAGADQASGRWASSAWKGDHAHAPLPADSDRRRFEREEEAR